MSTRNQTNQEASFRQQYDGEQAYVVGWDDIQNPSFSGKSKTAPTERDYTIAGTTFIVEGWSVGDYKDLVIQTTHSMKLNSMLERHIHACTPTDGTGTKVRFQLEIVAAGVGETFTAVTGSPFIAELDITEDISQKHTLFELAELPGINTTVSTIVLIKMTRIAATSNEYGGELYILFNDGHIQIDQERGSREEYAK